MNAEIQHIVTYTKSKQKMYLN